MPLKALLWIALGLATLWLLGRFVIGAGGFFVHSLLIAALILTAVWLLQRLGRVR
ncbi:MAG: hypothetical protein ACODAE_10860 [Gemmatimonadota bacterium]